MPLFRPPSRGFTLMEVIVGVAVMSIVFLGLTESFQAMATFGERNRLRAYALLLANEQIEAIRALPYDSIGTVAGLPSGSIPQVENIIHDGRTYTRRTFIQYVDDPADGTDTGDTLAADYKRVKVELSYDFRGMNESFSLTTTMAPKSQESLAGAGILRIVVNDANNAPLGLAEVHVVNTTVATSVNVTTFTNPTGVVSLPGAWAGSGYEVSVTKSGYSTARTYTTAEVPNPSPSPLTVAENSTTEVYFKIDQLSTIDLYARDLPVRGRLYDPFDDLTQVVAVDTAIESGALVLAGGTGSYVPMGTARSVAVTPASLGSWVLFRASSTIPAGTNIAYTIEYDTGGGVYAPVPDSDLPGNASGFGTTPIDLHLLDVATYPALQVVAELTSSDTSATPALDEWVISYVEADSPRTGLTVGIRGAKSIGTGVGDTPIIYKYDTSHTTDMSGRIALSGIEFDTYTLTPGAFVAEACPLLPLILEPDMEFEQTLTVGTASPHAYQVTVVTPSGVPVPYAEVRLQQGSTDETYVSGPCGVIYASGLAEETYDVSAYAQGYSPTYLTVPVSGLTTGTITLTL